MKSKKIYRDIFEKVFDFLDLCSRDYINRSTIVRTINLSSDEVISFSETLMKLGYIEAIESGTVYARGKMMYYKTTQKGDEFKRQITGWVELKRKHRSMVK